MTKPTDWKARAKKLEGERDFWRRQASRAGEALATIERRDEALAAALREFMGVDRDVDEDGYV